MAQWRSNGERSQLSQRGSSVLRKRTPLLCGKSLCGNRTAIWEHGQSPFCCALSRKVRSHVSTTGRTRSALSQLRGLSAAACRPDPGRNGPRSIAYSRRPNRPACGERSPREDCCLIRSRNAVAKSHPGPHQFRGGNPKHRLCPAMRSKVAGHAVTAWIIALAPNGYRGMREPRMGHRCSASRRNAVVA